MKLTNLPDVVKKDVVISDNPTMQLLMDVEKFKHIHTVAQLFAASTMVPDHFRNNVGNCAIALNLSNTLKVDPFMLMQNMYVVHGRPGIEAKLVIALVNQTGRFTPLKFKHENEGKKVTGENAWRCICHAKDIKSGEMCEQIVDWNMVVDEGWNKDKGSQKSKWNTIPRVMFQYRAASFFAKFYCPDAIFGMQTREELEDIVEMKNVGGFFESEKAPFDSILVREFDGAAKARVAEQDLELLDKFIVLTAKSLDLTAEQIKTDAADRIDEFFDAFDAWKAKSRKKTGADEWEEFRSEWIHLREPGYRDYVAKNVSRFSDAPKELKREAFAKWKKLYPGNAWNSHPEPEPGPVETEQKENPPEEGPLSPETDDGQF